jgi:branched-chain amino acid transport system ATP-binding protein
VLSLRIDNLSKHFGGLKAVDELSMKVPAGEITGLIGPNGAGKSTVVNMIAGVLSLTQGTITLGDEDIGTLPMNKIARRGVSRTFQNIRLLAEASVIDNIMIGFHRLETASLLDGLLGLPRAGRETRMLREKAAALLDRFGMTEFANLEAGSLAYGHQRRVEIMRAVASEPAILLLDEPVAGMNDVESEELAVIFRQLAASGIGLMLIEHNVGFVSRLCKHVYVLDAGRLIAEGDPQTVTRDPKVIAAYIGTSAP